MTAIRGPRVVVDAGLAVKWIVEEPHSAEAQSLLNMWVETEVVITAPALLAFEVTNILFHRVRRKQFELDAAADALSALTATRLALIRGEEAGLSDLAMQVANTYRLPGTYGAVYLALAIRSECALWTANYRLWRHVHHGAPWVHWVGEVDARLTGH